MLRLRRAGDSKPMTTFPLIAKTFTGLESVLADELAGLGATTVVTGRRMVSFVGDQELLYRANIWCRTAVRILKPVATFQLDPADGPADRALYAGLSRIDWARYLDVGGTLAIDPVVHSSAITNSLYASQVAKDSIADWFRARYDRRPNVDRDEPDLRLNLHIVEQSVTVYLDASGQSLHKRGYRRETGEAPLNEVLAAGILRLTGWDCQAPLVDFLCGSGTLPIEAALWARNIAPGTLGRQFGYMRWPDFDQSLHARLLDEARAARRSGSPLEICGSDIDAQVLAAAGENAARAGVAHDVRFAAANFDAVAPPAPAGLIVVNPPYDERLQTERIGAFYRRLGDVLKRRWSGYTGWIFTGNLDAAKQIGLRTAARIRLFNGPIECRLLKFPLFRTAGTSAVAIVPAALEIAPATQTLDAPAQLLDTAPQTLAATPAATAQRTLAATPTQTAVEAFRNRLRRMGRHWSRWARRRGITCYRLYDRDIPEVPLTVDRFEDELYIVEHARPHDRTPIEQQVWFDALVAAAVAELGVPRDRIHAHRRQASSVAGRSGGHDWSVVHEAGLAFEVSLWSRGEVGLPLDERLLRSTIRAEAAGRRFLNVFGGGGAASVFAAAGGAAASLTMERSPGLAAWSRGNLERNGFAGLDHAVVEAEPVEFLARLGRQPAPAFDLVLVAPPAGFHRRESEHAWDPRPEYLQLLAAVLQLVSPGGKIYFITASRRFRLGLDDLPAVGVRELTRQTLPPDCRDKPPHRSWSIVRK
jgi:23S rRNA (guanine2445-N2)-methyltransferase / 23S rRNA (guanine2069-N7)-methyltransferase